MSTFAVDNVRRYYERHTRTFVRFGEGGAVGAMHRAVLGPGVADKAAAFHYVDDLIIGIVRQMPTSRRPLHVIDLGCGVGGSLSYIAGKLPVIGTGITVSETQARLARERITAQELSARIAIVTADYASLPDSIASADVVFAIESFVHAPDAAAFFAQCQQIVRPDGVLIICDDFRRRTAASEAEMKIERFRRGWHVNTLLERSELQVLAEASGFRHHSTTDLTPFLDLGRPRDRVVDIVATLLERLPARWSRLDPWLGGSALQECLRRGWLGYDFAVFRKAAGA